MIKRSRAKNNIVRLGTRNGIKRYKVEIESKISEELKLSLIIKKKINALQIDLKKNSIESFNEHFSSLPLNILTEDYKKELLELLNNFLSNKETSMVSDVIKKLYQSRSSFFVSFAYKFYPELALVFSDYSLPELKKIYSSLSEEDKNLIKKYSKFNNS